MYNVVLIGCGHMGGVHLDDIYMMEDVCLYGVCDLCRERAEMFKKRYHALSCDTDYMRYLRDGQVDIVICATYPKTHLEILQNCIRYGKHLLCEKPITPDAESGAEFVRLARAASIKVLVGYILRHNETYQRVHDMIRGGMIGSPLVIRMTQNHHVREWGKYRALLENASPIVDCGVHYIDVCRWFTGAEVTDVRGIAAVTDPECPEGQYNYGMIHMRLSDGSAAFYEAGWGGSVAASNVKEFIGPKGRISITERGNRLYHEEGDRIEFYEKATGTYHTINVDCKRRPTGEQLRYLVRMIEEDLPGNPTMDDVYESFCVALRADKMMKAELGM